MIIFKYTYILYLIFYRIAQNFLKVVIYFEDLNYEEIKEEPMYDVGIFLYCIHGYICNISGFLYLNPRKPV